MEPDRLRRPRARRQHQRPQVRHPPHHGRLDQGHPAAHGELLQLRDQGDRRGASGSRRDHGHERAHRHRVLAAFPRPLPEAHPGLAREHRHPGIPALPGRSPGGRVHDRGPEGQPLPPALRAARLRELQQRAPPGPQRALRHPHGAPGPRGLPGLHRHGPGLAPAPGQVHPRRASAPVRGAGPAPLGLLRPARDPGAPGPGRAGPGHERADPGERHRGLPRARAQPGSARPQQTGRRARDALAPDPGPGRAGRGPDPAPLGLPAHPGPGPAAGRGRARGPLLLPGPRHSPGDLQPQGLRHGQGLRQRAHPGTPGGHQLPERGPAQALHPEGHGRSGRLHGPGRGRGRQRPDPAVAAPAPAPARRELLRRAQPRLGHPGLCRVPARGEQHLHPGRHPEGGSARLRALRALRVRPAAVLPLSQQLAQERAQDPARFRARLPDLLPDQAVVGPGLGRGVHLVRHHRSAQHHPVRARFRRPAPLAAGELEGLRELGAGGRFAPVYRFFPCPCWTGW